MIEADDARSASREVVVRGVRVDWNERKARG